MPISFPCSGCDRAISAPDGAAGKRAACKCGASTHVPRPLVFEEGDYREHHYAFAHRVIPAWIFAPTPNTALMLLMAQDGGETVRQLWDEAAQGLPARERLPMTGLKRTWLDLGRNSLAVIQLPPVRRQGEALFLGGAYTDGLREPTSTFRLLTLELGVELRTRIPRTVLGEWIPTGDGGVRHLNWGPGGPDSRELFVRDVQALLADPHRRPAAAAGVRR